MKQRMMALLLVLALVVSMGAVSALAEEQETKTPEEIETAENTGAVGTEEAGETPDAEDAADAEAAEGAEPKEEPVLAGPDREVTDLTEAVTIAPDEVGFLSFANVERRMRENNYQLLILEQQVLTIEEIDYDETFEDLRKQLNKIALGQWYMAKMDQEGTLAYEQMQQSYDAVREQYDAIKDGEMQQDNADLVRQLNNLEDQIVLAAESLYVTLLSLDTQEAALERQLTAMDRTVAEMDVRYQMGQISALQFSETQAGRTKLASALETLRMNIRNYKLQMEMLIGAEQTGAIELSPVPEVTAEQLEAMDPEADLMAAKEKSWELYDAGLTLEEARDDYKEAGDDYAYDEKYDEFRAAKRTWNAAQYTYNDVVQNFELKFRTLYGQVKDCQQILESAKVSLACEEVRFAAAEMRYEQGMISTNALADANDAMRAAEENVQTAASDLFAAYNSYCWAVQNGILN